MKYYPLHYLNVEKDEEGIRLSCWLKRRFPALPNGRWQALIRKGRVRVNGKRSRHNERLMEGKIIRIPPLFEEARAQFSSPKSTQKRMIASLKASIFEKNEDFIVLNKPYGLACQGGTGIDMSVDRLLPFVLEAEEDHGSNNVYLVHRLDKNTTGALIVARKRTKAEHLSRLFAQRALEKTYTAILCSSPQKKGIWNTSLEDKNGKERPAQTHFTLLKKHSSGLSLVLLHPRTGRKHQLRRHSQLAGVPILGDGQYGGDRHSFLRNILGSFLASSFREKMFLHGRALLLDGRCFLAPLPSSFKTLCQHLGWSLDTLLSTWETHHQHQEWHREKTHA